MYKLNERSDLIELKYLKGQLKGHDQQSSFTVAVKVLKASANPEARHDLLHEAEIMGSFQHHNILSLRGIVLHGKLIKLH